MVYDLQLSCVPMQWGTGFFRREASFLNRSHNGITWQKCAHKNQQLYRFGLQYISVTISANIGGEVKGSAALNIVRAMYMYQGHTGVTRVDNQS